MKLPLPIFVLILGALVIAWSMGRKPVLGALYGTFGIVAAMGLAGAVLPADDRLISLAMAAAAGYGGVWLTPRR